MRAHQNKRTTKILQTSLLTACLVAFMLPAGTSLESETLDTPSAGYATASSSVSVFDFGFEDGTTMTPATVVSVGDSVTFTFDEGAHTATATLGGFDSGVKAPGSDDPTYTVTFSEPGVHEYLCEIHPVLMHGVIVVTP